MLTRRLAFVAAFALAVTVRAEDPPKQPTDTKPPADAAKPEDPKPKDTAPPADSPKAPGSSILNPNSGKPQMRSVGQIQFVVSKVDGSTISTKVTEMERNTNNNNNNGRRKGGAGGQLHPTQKDKDYDLAPDVKVRWHNMPKKSDGKSYTDSERKALMEPVGTPGYKADMSDLKAGQTVKLYLSKGYNKEDKVVATVVMIVTDAPKDAPKDSDPPKKKKKTE